MARHLQTRRLIAGDSLSLDQDKSFYCVVDGLVQVFAPTNDDKFQAASWDEDSTNGYQLINEVRSGGTLSSLFTILSLFTEDIKISWPRTENSDAGDESISRNGSSGKQGRPLAARARADFLLFDLDKASLNKPSRRRGEFSSSSSTRSTDINSVSDQHSEYATPDADTESRTPKWSGVPLPQRQRQVPDVPMHENHGTVARAVEDTTLAVIPAEAFRRLTKMFPKSSAHIVQGRHSSASLHR